MMISLKPRSILQLTLMGFLAVTGLLVVALAITASQVADLSTRTQQVVSQNATAMEASRVLIEQSSAMERNARQFSVTGDKEILEVYSHRRITFDVALQRLATMSLNQKVNAEIATLAENELALYNQLNETQAIRDARTVRLSPLLEIAYGIANGVSDWSHVQLAELHEESDQARALLSLQALLLVAAALVLAGIFTTLITRPLLQVERAIDRLGSGAYEDPINISGPRDLVNLGHSLDWLRSRLGKLEHERSSFLRHVSHELKTPLAAIHESTALLADGVVGQLTEEQAEILRIQGSNCQRLQGLIDDLLRYNSESFSVLNAMPHPVRLDAIVDRVVAAHELVIKSGHVSIVKDLAKIPVLGDYEQLRVIVDNLITNAIKFSPDPGVVTIAIHQENGWCLLDVIDQGPGVPLDETEKIFDAFYQGRKPARQALKGSGLGLAIALEYIKANAGEVEVIQRQQGAQFRVRFPLILKEPP